MYENEKISAEIREAIRSGYCVPIVGAGVSIPAGLPSWSEHLKDMAVGLGESFRRLAEVSTSDPTDIATLLQWERLRCGLPPVAIRAMQPGTIHQSLARWRCPLYLTTNFDGLLERAIQDLDGEAVAIFNDQLDDLDLDFCFRRRTSSPRSFKSYVVKLCSSTGNANPGAETKDDFAKLIWGQNGALELLVTALRASNAVFVGCGMADPLLNAAIDKCFASGVGQPKSIAFVPADMSPERKASLKVRGVAPLEFAAINKTVELKGALDQCAPVAEGLHHLLIFEPGMASKLEQLLTAVGKCNTSSTISVLGIVTTNSALAARAERWGAAQTPQIPVFQFLVRDTALTNEIVRAVLANHVRWTGIVTPYEYATKDAAEFAEQYNSQRPKPVTTHSKAAAELSRNKTRFKEFLREMFSNHELIAPTRFDEISLGFDQNWKTLFEAISNSPTGKQCREVVVKPIDASGSTGVRPIDQATDKIEQTKEKLVDLLQILRSMPVDAETSRCETSRLLVEERLRGEEFSFESKRLLGTLEPILAHWKVDIDSDDSRFFERLFVTLPHGSSTFELLKKGNEALLHEMGVADGVFHGEYRMSSDLSRIYPLEVGLRPGGGMVNYSVQAARGVDLHEASIQCALKIPNPRSRRTQDNTIVSTGLVFATSATGGVLPPLRFADPNGTLTVVDGDVDSLRERLQRLIDSANREEAYDYLSGVISRDNALCNDVRGAFSNRDGYGLRATIDLIEIWMKPGEMITEEEAAYVAGLRIVADPGLNPLEAMADAVAAMRMCLASLKCEPEKPLQAFSWRSSHNELRPAWWLSAGDSTFLSDVDSWNYSRALANLADKIKSVVDLGCGSAKPALPLISNRVFYVGVDLQESAIIEAKANVARLGLSAESGQPVPKFLVGDVLDEQWSSALNGESFDAVAANLPYLPGPDGALDMDVDGGARGIRFSPSRAIAVAELVHAKFVVVTTSSLCDLESFSLQVAQKGYGTIHVVATVAPLGSYSQSVLGYLRKESFARLYGVEGDLRQIIYSFTLVRSKGISIKTAVSQVSSVLKPDGAMLHTIVEGFSNW